MTQTQIPPEWEGAKKYVAMHEPELRARYGNNYLAITPDGIIDYDESKPNLARRLHKRTHMSINPLISSIDEVFHPRRVELPSPEIVARGTR